MANNNMRGMSFGLSIAFGMLGGAIVGMLFLDNIGRRPRPLGWVAEGL